MSVCGIKRKQIHVSLPVAAFNSLEQLAQKEGLTIHQYSRKLIEREILKNNYPLYWQDKKSSD